MILQTDFPPDIRIEKEAKSLIEAGHEIHLITRNQKNFPVEENVYGIQVHRLPFYQHRRVSIPLFFNPVWTAKVKKIVRQNQIDVIHVHDLPLASLGISVARKFKIPVVYDMHENYPAVMEIWRKKSLAHLTIRNPKFARLLDRHCQKRADRIVVVVDEQRDNLIAQGIAPEKIYVVSNTVDFNQITEFKPDSGILQKYKDNFVLLYFGGFSRDRNLETPILGIKPLIHPIPNLKLVLVGSDTSEYAAELKSLVAENKLENFVEFVDWVPFERVASYITAAKIGVDPRPDYFCNNTTIPHKIFQYMSLGLPLVVSDAKPMARIIREAHSGEVFKSKDPTAFAAAVRTIYYSKIAYGQNGIKIIKEKYNWKNSSFELLKLYQSLAGKKLEGK
jgi:glycosyltransferase involved in cell wall biosynthesis